MNTAFVRKELRENRMPLLIVFAVLCLAAIVYPRSYGGMFLSLLQQGITFDKLLWYDWFQKAQPQIMLIAALILGSTSIARESRNATLGILVTRPLSRAGVLGHKLLSGGLALTGVLAASTFVLTVASRVLGAPPVSAGILLVGLLGDILLVLVAYTSAVACSVFFLSSVKAGALSTAMVLAFYAPVWFGSSFSAIWWLMATPATLNPWCAAGLLAAGALFVALGIWRFRRTNV